MEFKLGQEGSEGKRGGMRESGQGEQGPCAGDLESWGRPGSEVEADRGDKDGEHGERQSWL